MNETIEVDFLVVSKMKTHPSLDQDQTKTVQVLEFIATQLILKFFLVQGWLTSLLFETHSIGSIGLTFPTFSVFPLYLTHNIFFFCIASSNKSVHPL